MGGWKKQSHRSHPNVWGLQETHIASEVEARSAAQLWTSLWGRQHITPVDGTSYWSVSGDKAGGVALLLDPRQRHVCQPWQQELWSKRFIALVVDDTLFIDVYAPNDRHEREDFFEGLRRWPWPQLEVIFFVNCNCVQSPHFDRLGSRRSGRPESPALDKLISTLDLEDAQALASSALEDDVVKPLDYFTYWNAQSASRIDRFYVCKT